MTKINGYTITEITGNTRGWNGWFRVTAPNGKQTIARSMTEAARLANSNAPVGEPSAFDADRVSHYAGD